MDNSYISQEVDIIYFCTPVKLIGYLDNILSPNLTLRENIYLNNDSNFKHL